MSRYIKHVFPAADTEAVSLTQTLGAAGALTLDGNLSNTINSEVSFIKDGYSRNVSITSVNDINAATFTINGTIDGFFATEDIDGVNANTVDGISSFDTITSVTVDGAVAAVSVGSGPLGYFTPIKIDQNMDGVHYSLTLMAELGQNIIPTSISGTNDKGNITDNNYIELKAESAEANYTFPEPVEATLSTYMPLFYSLFINIAGVNATRANGVELEFIQV